MTDDNGNWDTQDFVTLTGLIVTVLAGVSFLICLGYFASNSSVGALIAAGCALLGTAVFGSATALYAHDRSPEEKVLTWRQRRDLARARGSVVMEKALIEVEHERQNIVHREIEAANDPDKPPHQTQWTSEDENKVRRLERPGYYDKD